jgi:glycosyltransferase involved in cell wall biosynthesis
MSNPPAEKEAITVVLPVHNPGAALEPSAGVWLDYLGKLGRDYEFLIVDDGSTDGTAAMARELVGKRRNVRVLTHDAHRGFGASLRTALAEAKYPLFFYTALDYPYTPSDLNRLLDRIGDTDELLHRRIDVVGGCRTGLATPQPWKGIGTAFRWFCRIALGLPLDTPPGWQGVKERRRSWVAWLLFGTPLTDVNCAFKVFRRSVFDKFPIQSDGGFVHAELIAKCTFTTCLMDELPLTPKPDAIPDVEWSELGKVLRDAKFTAPPSAAPEPPKPTPEAVPESAASPVSQP